MRCETWHLALESVALRSWCFVVMIIMRSVAVPNILLKMALSIILVEKLGVTMGKSFRIEASDEAVVLVG